MNKFKDKNGVQWMSTTAASKAFRVPSATLYNWKYTGDMKEGVHYTANKYPSRKIFWNADALAEFIEERYPGKYAVPKKAKEVAAKDPAARRTEKSMYSNCLLYTSPSPRDQRGSRMPSSA